MKKIVSADLNAREADRLLNSVIVPRPIAFVSTINKNNVPNAAPFCFFMGVTSAPPTIALSVIRRGDQKKDTIRNIENTREFVINLVDEQLSQAMNIASGNYPPDMSEFDVTGLTQLASEMVAPPRIAESPVHLECRLKTILDLGDIPASIVIGEVVCFHVRESLFVERDGNLAIDFLKLKAVGRLDDSIYVKTSDLFEMRGPA